MVRVDLGEYLGDPRGRNFHAEKVATAERLLELVRACNESVRGLRVCDVSAPLSVTITSAASLEL